MSYMTNRIFRMSFFLLFTFLILPLFAETKTIPIANWRWMAADDPMYAKSDYDDSAWNTVVLPDTLEIGEVEKIFWLRSICDPNTLGKVRLWFLSGNMGVALEVYADGLLIGSRGKLPPDYSLRATQYSAIELPESLVTSGKPVVIALRCAYQGSIAPLPLYQLGNEAAMKRDMVKGNFLNGDIYIMFAAICTFLGLYFLLQFIFPPHERTNLFYALAMLFLAFYLAELGTTVWPFRAPWIRAIARASLLFSMFLLLPFFIEFFDILRKKWIYASCFFICFVFLVFFLVLSGDETKLMAIFSLTCTLVFIPILTEAVICVIALRKGNSEGGIVLVAIVIGITLALHDASYTMKGSSPFVWMQGFAFFGLNISIFITLAMRQASMKKALERYAHEVEQKTEAVSASFARVEEAGKDIAELAKKLDSAASHALLAAQASAARSRGIGEEAGKQAVEANAADALVSDFLSSIGRVNERLTDQTASLSTTAGAASQLSSAAELVAGNVAETSEFTGALSGMTGDGASAAAALDVTMKQVAESSSGITAIVKAVEDFAERTNMLAMNAAIEAAHAGQSGRGFAIIANEIKKLAQSQAEGAVRIRNIVLDIQGQLESGAAQSERVRTALATISSGAEKAANRLELVSEQTREQRRASEDIHKAIETLSTAVRAISDEVETQTERSNQVRQSVAGIALVSDSVLAATRAIIEDGKSLSDAIQSVETLAGQSRQMTTRLLSKN